MAVRLLKVSSLATAVLASSGFYLSSKQLDINDLSVIRFGRAALTTAVISYDYLTAFRHVAHGSEEYWALKSKVHQRSAERLLDLCCANRGTFIKVGQHLGALDYLLPEEYTSTLKVLHSRAPQSSMEEIQQVIREDLGKELSELFVLFEEKPHGAASLAQVHKAVLHDGKTVAVKVQHPKVQRQSSKDIMVMEVLVKAVHWLFPDFAFMWLVEESKKNMPLELDFLNEGHNAEKVANMLSHFPFLKISENLGKMYSEMIFVHGFVHCDPHPGNVLVRKCPRSQKTEILLLDHGLYQDVEIRTNAAQYLPQISDLLNRVPRQMLLLLKTTDLLRGIETTLQTRASSSSFINMSRCCVRAVARHKRIKARSRRRRLQITLAESLSLWKLSVYELLLWVRGLVITRWLAALLTFLH
ncbi:aarF domain-containing protein kinase 1 isoform X4 [Nematolebias whitei]|uniref:aarF domain-containing protein kinase 1 isoform X4 n=1 Tax=Nematolebias whitei TaxID=451745 RepID=UPI00189A08E4|nr:aarF domain-containing protein kinase 1 isoform X4 [Nematolebias whitei]